MKRRLFFRALLGAPAAAVAVTSEPKAGVGYANLGTSCECGMDHWIHGHTFPASQERFATCRNPSCRLYDVPIALARTELLPADPEIVRRVRMEEEAEHAAAQAREREIGKPEYLRQFAEWDTIPRGSIVAGTLRPQLFLQRPARWSVK